MSKREYACERVCVRVRERVCERECVRVCASERERLCESEREVHRARDGVTPLQAPCTHLRFRVWGAGFRF